MTKEVEKLELAILSDVFTIVASQTLNLLLGNFSKHDLDGSENVNLKMSIRVSAISFQLFKFVMFQKDGSNYPGIKLERALGTYKDKIEHLLSYALVVHTTAKQVISSRRKNENVFKMSKDEKCTCKACKNTVFYCQICKFKGFLFPSSLWLLKLRIISN